MGIQHKNRLSALCISTDPCVNIVHGIIGQAHACAVVPYRPYYIFLKSAWAKGIGQVL